jgi:hypothetical protein
LAGVEPNPKLGLTLPVLGAALKPKEELVDELATALVEEVDVTDAASDTVMSMLVLSLGDDDSVMGGDGALGNIVV